MIYDIENYDYGTPNYHVSRLELTDNLEESVLVVALDFTFL